MSKLRPIVFFFVSFFLITGLESRLVSGSGGDSEKGKLVYETGCLACHGERGKGDGPLGAALRPPPADLTSSKTKAKPDQDLIKVIRDGRGTMPGWKGRLKEQDMQNVLAYIRSLRE